MPKFFVEPNCINENQITLPFEETKHLHVIRCKNGDNILVCDGYGIDYNCKIKTIEPKKAVLEIIDYFPSESEPNFKITLFQALPKNDKMELIIQKCVELGVYNIVPVETENTVCRINEKTKNKISRWQKISESAAKQCNRGIIPRIENPVNFLQAVEMLKSLDEAYVAYENEQKNSAKKTFKVSKGENVGIFIGSEGGFTEQEIACCLKNNIKSISLGKRILRTETAGFVSITLLMFIREEV